MFHFLCALLSSVLFVNFFAVDYCSVLFLLWVNARNWYDRRLCFLVRPQKHDMRIHFHVSMVTGCSGKTLILNVARHGYMWSNVKSPAHVPTSDTHTHTHTHTLEHKQTNTLCQLQSGASLHTTVCVHVCSRVHSICFGTSRLQGRVVSMTTKMQPVRFDRKIN